MLFLFPLCFADVHANAAERKGRNVIYVTLDGMRWQEIFGGAQELFISKDAGVANAAATKENFWRETEQERREVLMPFLWKTIAKQGQIFGDPVHHARARITNTMKFSYPGYSEMFVGFADDEKITSNNKFPNPHVNVLEFLQQRPGFEGRVAAFATWDRIEDILNRERSGIYVHAGIKPVEDPPLTPRQELLNALIGDTVELWPGNLVDSLTFHSAREYLLKHKPRVFYLGLGETDEWGHGRRYDLYLNAAQKADAFLQRLWEELQQLPEYAGSTSLVISTDHGRGETIRNWTDHGQKVEEAEYIWMAVLGPDTPALGVRSDVEATQSQIAATLAKLVGEDFVAAHPKAAPALSGVLGE